MFEDLDEKMKHSWRLRWHHRWEKLKLDISEWWCKYKAAKLEEYKKDWSISKVNGRWVMTRCIDNAIEGRRLTTWEKVKYFWLKDDAQVKIK